MLPEKNLRRNFQENKSSAFPGMQYPCPATLFLILTRHNFPHGFSVY
jgi:hypothetical protein